MIDGGTDSYLTIPNVTMEWQGHYQCRVTNTEGVTVSDVVTVELAEFAPRILEQPPASLVVPFQGSARLAIVGAWPLDVGNRPDRSARFPRIDVLRSSCDRLRTPTKTCCCCCCCCCFCLLLLVLLAAVVAAAVVAAAAATDDE